IDEGPGLGDPVVLEVPPMATHRITTHSANVVVSAQHGPGQTFQNNAKSAGRDVEMAGLEPDPIGIRHPATLVRYVDARNEVLAASATRIEAISKTVESSDRHKS